MTLRLSLQPPRYSSDEQPAPPAVPFVIIFAGRTGSSHLVSLLNQDPRVLCYPEILVGLNLARQERAVHNVAHGLSQTRPNGYRIAEEYFTPDLATKLEMRPFKAVGFKTKVTDLFHAPALLQHLKWMGFRMIYMRRRNVLKAALSSMNATRLNKKTGAWNAAKESNVQGALNVDLVKFNQELEHRELVDSLHDWFYAHYQGYKQTVYYEDMLEDEGDFLSSIFNFLDVPLTMPRVLRRRFHKNTPDHLEGAVRNYQEFKTYFADTPYARHLDLPAARPELRLRSG
jgi:LPS sulfotransferase NodH